jgi:hypothetical protein
LRLRGFIEKGYTNLIPQRFPVVKVMVDEEVLDIQVMWNSKSNGHNLPFGILVSCWMILGTLRRWWSNG